MPPLLSFLLLCGSGLSPRNPCILRRSLRDRLSFPSGAVSIRLSFLRSNHLVSSHLEGVAIQSNSAVPLSPFFCMQLIFATDSSNHTITVRFFVHISLLFIASVCDDLGIVFSSYLNRTESCDFLFDEASIFVLFSRKKPQCLCDR